MTANDTITAVPGVGVGHWTNDAAVTGVTVMSLPEPNVTAVEVRGGAPGTRDVALLAPDKRVEMVQAIVFAGGSAFGLAAADGVMRRLEEEGRGHQTIAGKVPIVPTAIIFDLMIGDGKVRPTADDGAAAYDKVSTEPVVRGSVGAGTGATVGAWRGIEHIRKGGIGSAAVKVGSATVAALAVVNATGDVFTADGISVTGGDVFPEGPGFDLSNLEHTTLVTVATDARLRRTDLLRLNVRAHDALGVCLRPAHTRYDGDVVFSVSCGAVEEDPDHLGEAVFRAVAESLVDAVTSATPLGGVAAIGESV